MAEADPRVLFAAERTLLAWTRTSLSLVGFGFVVERSGPLLEALSKGEKHSVSASFSFWVGLAFIALGALTAGYSARQHGSLLQTLGTADVPAGYGTKWGMVVHGVVAGLSLCLLLALLIWRAE